MLLKSIKYKNFRPFIGSQLVDFTGMDSTKNVVVLLGNNTAGKTTFMRSFKWCLYGVYGDEKKACESVLNKRVELNMADMAEEEAFVELSFFDNDKLYVVKRLQKLQKQQGRLLLKQEKFFVTYTDEKGAGQSVSITGDERANEAVREILPYDLSSYFFFEGEKDNQLNKEELGTAVRKLLGLAAFDNMKEHLFGPAGARAAYSNSVIGAFAKMKIDKDSAQVQTIIEKKKKDEDEAGKCKTELNNKRQSYDNTVKRLGEIEDELRRIEPIKEIAKRREELEIQKANAEEEMKKASREYIHDFGKESLDLIINPLLAKVQDRLLQLNIADKGMRGLEAAAIRTLLENHKCLCGTCLQEGSAAYNNVQKWLERVPPKSLGTLILDLQEQMEERQAKSKDFVAKLNTKYAQIQAQRRVINECEQKIDEADKQIKELGDIDINKLNEERINCKENIKKLHEEIVGLTVKANTLEDIIKGEAEKLNAFEINDTKTAHYALCHKYAQEIYNWVATEYDKRETKMRQKLNEYVSAIFDKMYTGHRDISVDENYNINLTYAGASVDDTGGLRAVQYFAYVAGLVQLAYEVINTKDGVIDKIGEEYPLVLDAAFSHADDAHTKNVAKELANAANQLVFALMYKDWEYAKAGLQAKIAKMYELQKVDEIEVHIVEVQ